MLNTTNVIFGFSDTQSDPVSIDLIFPVDGVALESDELFSLELVPTDEASLPIVAGFFFRRNIELTIVDRDGRFIINFRTLFMCLCVLPLYTLRC